MNESMPLPGPLDPLAIWQSYWTTNARLADLAFTRTGGVGAIGARARQRLGELVRFARAHSAYYHDLYRGLPQDIDDPSCLPVVDKRGLMAEFDRWVTDPRLTLQRVRAFTEDPARIGDLLLGEFAVWRSSGSSGEPGIFVHDRDALAVYDALGTIQMQSLPRLTRYAMGLASAGGRSAMIVATEGHFASVATARRLQKANPMLALKDFSVSQPLESLVAQLNDYQPAFVSSYPTALALLAQARQAGQLRIRPLSLWSGGEFLSAPARALIEAAFGCPLINEYGTSECLSIAYGCDQGALHVNSDWVLLEPVDRQYRPVAPGEPSHTVLLTNLANRAQPIIRYDLGDSIVAQPRQGVCGCGSSLPSIQVEGRRDDVLTMQRDDGRPAALLPLALATAVEQASDVHRFQLIQTGTRSLSIRVEPRPGVAREDAWHSARDSLHSYLRDQGFADATLTLDALAPTPDAASGKLHAVIAMPEPTAAA